MQHDAVAAGTYGMTKADGAAIDVQSGAIDLPGGAVEPENLAAEFLVVPRSDGRILTVSSLAILLLSS